MNTAKTLLLRTLQLGQQKELDHGKRAEYDLDSRVTITWLP